METIKEQILRRSQQAVVHSCKAPVKHSRSAGGLCSARRILSAQQQEGPGPAESSHCAKQTVSLTAPMLPEKEGE